MAAITMNTERTASVEIAPSVHWLEVGKGLMRSNVYFVASGQSWCLIDTGTPQCAGPIRREAGRLFGAGARPTAILLTHAHPDHGGSALALAEQWRCPIYVSRDEFPLAVATDPAIFTRFANPLDRWVILPVLRLIPGRRRKEASEAARRERVIWAFDPAAGVPGLPAWQCIPTSGHTPGHIAFFRPADRVLIAGDAILTVETNTPPGFIRWCLGRDRPAISGSPWYSTWDWPRSKRSIADLAKLSPAVLAGGHGTPMRGTGAEQGLRDLAVRLDPVRANGTPPDAPRRRTKMVHINGEITIDRPVEDVFDTVADERNEPNYNPRLQWVEQITDGPIGAGTRFAAMTTTMGRPAEMIIEFTQYERPRRLGSVTKMDAMDIAGTLSFTPVPRGTLLRWSWELHPRGATRHLSPLIARMGRRQEQEIWTGLKRYIEAPATANQGWPPPDER